MTTRGAVRPTAARSRKARQRLGRAVLTGLLAVLAAFIVLPDAGAAPAAPVPVATTSPSATPTDPSSSATPSATPRSTTRPSPRPDPEGDRWVELAVVGGGSLLGAVVMFMLIGGLIRWRNRRRYRD